MKIISAIIVFLMLTAGTRAADPAPPNRADLTKAGATAQLPGLVIHGGDKPFIEASGKVSLQRHLGIPRRRHARPRLRERAGVGL